MSVRDLPVSMHVLSDSYNYKTIALLLHAWLARQDFEFTKERDVVWTKHGDGGFGSFRGGQGWRVEGVNRA